ALYEALAPLLISLPSVFGPGGVTPVGYVRAPRLTQFSHAYAASDRNLHLGPLVYPHPERDYGGGRSHLSLEYPRSPAALSLVVAILALAHRAWALDPGRFRLALADPIRAGRTLSL